MTIEEIFGHLSAHMVEGIMTHSQLADYYNFIGLKGYAKCHEYHYMCENKGFRNLSHYLLEHHNKLVPELSSSNPNVIPDSWFNYSRQDVDTATRKTAIQLGAETWVNWERKTKMLYQNMYNEFEENYTIFENNVKKFIETINYYYNYLID